MFIVIQIKILKQAHLFGKMHVREECHSIEDAKFRDAVSHPLSMYCPSGDDTPKVNLKGSAKLTRA